MGCSDCIHFAVCADLAEMFIKAIVEQKPPSDICPNFEDRALWRKHPTEEES